MGKDNELIESKRQKSEDKNITADKEISDKKILIKFKQCIWLVGSFFNALKDIFISKKEDDTYVSLGPTKNADPNGTYSNALKYAIDNKEIKNIAIAGKYGSGKSSIIKTFFDKLENKKYNPILISLAAFNKNDYLAHNKVEENYDEEEKGTKEIQTKNEFYHTLEKSILQQLLYQASENEVPLSRFRRISKHSKFLFGIATIFIIVAILTIICLIFPTIIDSFKNNYNAVSTSIGGIIMISCFIILLITIIALTYKTIFFLSKRFNISKFKFKDAEVEINDKAESIFNKYLDEIIYFFQVTNHQVVVIEDLDRYEGDASFIFQKLRELNTLINSSNQVKYEVDFIYAIRDDFFENHEERTKFFDYIIPVIPITSSGNSNELIWERLEKLKNEGKLKQRLKKSFIDDISIVVEDKRLIDNTINEFIIYKNVFDNEHMDDTQLFSIILYKNIYPREYAELQENRGNIVKIFKNKKEKIEELVQEINNKKRELEEQKELVISEKLKTSKELKCALIGSIYDYNNYDGYGREFQVGSEKISIEDFINKDIDTKKLSDSTIKFKSKGYSRAIYEENEIFSLFGNKTAFISRIETLNKGTKIKIEEIQHKIEKLNDEITNITKLTIKQLIEEYGENKIFSNETRH